MQGAAEDLQGAAGDLKVYGVADPKTILMHVHAIRPHDIEFHQIQCPLLHILILAIHTERRRTQPIKKPAIEN